MPQLLRVLLVSEEGKCSKEKYSKGDTVVGASFEMETKQMSVRRSHKLAKYKKGTPVDDISSDLVHTGREIEGTKATEKWKDEGPIEDPSHFSNLNQMLQEDSTKSLDSRVGADAEI